MGKGPMFGIEERTEMVLEEIAVIQKSHRDNTIECEMEVVSFGSLLTHFCEEQGARFIIRGLRAVSDFEYEFQMTGMNYQLSPDIETVFLMSSDNNSFISSSTRYIISLSST